MKTWIKPVIRTMNESELLHKLSVKADSVVAHEDGHSDAHSSSHNNKH